MTGKRTLRQTNLKTMNKSDTKGIFESNVSQLTRALESALKGKNIQVQDCSTINSRDPHDRWTWLLLQERPHIPEIARVSLWLDYAEPANSDEQAILLCTIVSEIFQKGTESRIKRKFEEKHEINDTTLEQFSGLIGGLFDKGWLLIASTNP